MSALVTNQAQMRPHTFSGSPKKNATFGSREAKCQTRRMMTSSSNCQKRKLAVPGLIKDFDISPLQGACAPRSA
ncbi:hypothetical protein D9M68_945510 [compost metagenome]